MEAIRLRDVAPLVQVSESALHKYPNAERRQELRHLRVNVGEYMTQRQAARKLGLTMREYSAIELGSLEPVDWNAMWERLFDEVLP